MTLRRGAARSQRRRVGPSIYVPIVLSLGVILAVCIYPHLAAPLSTAAAVVAASVPALRSRRGSQQGLPSVERGASDSDTSDGGEPA